MSNITQDQLIKMHRLSEISEQFLQLSSETEIDYQWITDVLRELSEAKFVGFNLYDLKGEFFYTQAISGETKAVKRATRLLGFDLVKKKWENDPIRAAKIAAKTTTHFNRLADCIGGIIPQQRCDTLQKNFNIGEIMVVKIMVNQVMIGEFILLMEQGKPYLCESMVEIYSRQVGMIMTRNSAQQALKESKVNFNTLFDQGPIGIAYHKMIYNAKGEPIDYLFLEVNHSFIELTGDNPTGKLLTEAFPGVKKDPFDWIGTYGKVAKDGIQIRFQQYFQANQRWYDCLAFQYQPDHFVVTFFEITEKKEIEKSLEISEATHKEIIASISDAILIMDKDRLVKYQSANSERIFGWASGDLMGRGYYRFIHPDDIEIIRKQFYDMINEGINQTSFECRVKDKTGVFRTVDIYAVNLVTNPSINGILVTFHDISDRKVAEIALKQSEAKYRIITDNVSDVISVINLDQHRTTYVSPSIFNQRGYTVEEVMNERFEHALTPQSMEKVRSEIFSHAQQFKINQQGHYSYILEIQQTHRDGRLIWIEISARYQLNNEQEVELLVVSRNIDERKKAELERNYLSFHDHLTGMYNRRFFEAELLRLDIERNYPISILMGDVNGLKLINDSFGHETGDELLIKTAQVIRAQLREDEISARLGGDEFAILLPKTSTDVAQRIINRIQNALINEKVANITPSISFGMSVKENDGENISVVLKNAEDSMYRTKLYESRSSRSKTIDVILNALFEKSKREQMHSKRVSLYCEKIAIALGYNQERVNKIMTAGLVHDIGKIGIDERILNKNGQLDQDELIAVRKHPEAGWRILNSVNEFSELSEFILTHHENIDGTGYPRGLQGDDIPIEARIIAIADAFDAMTSQRSYRDPLCENEARLELLRCCDTQFDSQLVHIFLNQVLI